MAPCILHPGGVWLPLLLVLLLLCLPEQQGKIKSTKITTPPPTTTPVPSPVPEVTIRNQTVDSLEIEWTQPGDAHVATYMYRICLSKCTNVSQSPHIVKDLKAGVTYTVVVYVVTKNNINSTEKAINATTAPKDLNAKLYMYYLSWFPENNPDLLKNETVTGTSYTIHQLQPGLLYFVNVSSMIHDLNLKSKEMTEWFLTPPCPPTNFSIQMINQTAAVFTWVIPSSPFSGYQLKWKSLADSKENQTCLQNSSTGAVLSGLTPSTNYTFTLLSLAKGKNLSVCSTDVQQHGATSIYLQDEERKGSHHRTSGCCAAPLSHPQLAAALFQEMEVSKLITVSFSCMELSLPPSREHPGLRKHSNGLEKPKPDVGPPEVLASLCVPPCTDSIFPFSLLSQQQLQDIGTGQSQSVAERPENQEKNRYSNVLPYDHARVQLIPRPGDPNSDYINASYMPGFKRGKEFIAAQGPLRETVYDFWRMIWEQRSTTLVMLTNCVESGRVKCERYWPLDYTPCTYEDISVSVVTETILPDWTVRDFRIKRVSEWDHGVPHTTNAVLHFRDLVRGHIEEHEDSGPALVHCSAGVGRTGTFIALDSLLRQAQEEGQMDLHIKAASLPPQSQYIFLHQCLLERIKPAVKNGTEETEYTAVYENTLALQNYEVSRV
ncbi:hypothetical protein JD844_001535 [Phrynosoma platyrhinos]|uniref:Protein-tyrosine-phosphatase n=1 Tax=Phrynosoma platyrhinos TaxID=52577 RepID=A0ABQ7TAQ2_PHRPL|nr:hypothetical protein JD844_001535 [Phrynosoma platyrhinos]